MIKLPGLLAVLALLLLCPVGGAAADLVLSRPVRSWEFLDAVGPRAGLLGKEDGAIDAYVYPLKILSGLRLRFVTDHRVVPAESISRRITARAGSTTLTYSGDDFRVAETLFVPADQPGAVVLIDVDAQNPVRIDAEFTRDFQLMWPASIGSGYGEWHDDAHAFVFGADGQPFAAVFGSPDASLISREYATNYSTAADSRFTLGTIKGYAERVLAVAGSMKSREEAMIAYRALIQHPAQTLAATERSYRDYLANTIDLDLPDAALQRAYDWSRISMVKGFVDNPFLGRGLVAGYGPSKGTYRPGFAWFFGRDSLWTSFALTSSGDFANARAAIAFVSQFQRDDGKVPHEISQSARQVDWWKQFPYGFASADATPLFAIATADYVRASGDVAFAREQAPRLWKALAFMKSTLDDSGFPKNYGVGHGWVEGGPLLPVRVELYQAACYVQALQSLASIARLLHDDARARELDAEYTQKREAIEDRFWLPQSHAYAYALDLNGRPVDQPSVLATVPMWFGALDPAHTSDMLQSLAREEHAADWGMRIISSHAALYDPSGYHFGSVWPLFTGWASVGEYRYHAAEAGLANLRANAWLALDGAGGNTTEVLSGDTYSPLSTASPHQIWSAAMVVSPILRGMLGLESNAGSRHMLFAPHLPASWDHIGVKSIPFLGDRVGLALTRDRDGLQLIVNNSGNESFDLEFAPAYPPCAQIVAAAVDGSPAQWKNITGVQDWHPSFTLAVKPGVTTLAIRHKGYFGYSVPYDSPALAEPSFNLKVIAERWSDNGRHLALTVSGRPGREYRLGLTGVDLVAKVDNAVKTGNQLVVQMPQADSGQYVDREIQVTLR